MSILKRLVLFLVIVVIFAVFKEYQDPRLTYIPLEKEGENHIPHKEKETRRPDLNWRQYPKEKRKKLTILSQILFFNESIPPIDHERKYKILVWKYGPTIEKRHLYHFTNHRHDPFEKCTVKNCQLTYENKDLATSDLVIVHLHRTEDVHDLPPQTNRSRDQIWAFLTDESPYHTFLSSKNKLQDFNGIFNWSMTYRMDSDIPVPYGRTVLKESPTSDQEMRNQFLEWKHKKRRDVLIAIMGSNCGSKNHRWEYVDELEKHIPVHKYGNCGNLSCGGHFNVNCEKLDSYMFYLAFENSNCDEYVTEKLWWNAYHKKSIPIVMGANKESYYRLLPPHSYLNVDDFANPKALADLIKYLNRSEESSDGLYNHFFGWQKDFEIKNEHGYFQSESFHYCRACEALNYNEKYKKIYDNLQDFWSTRQCFPRWDEGRN